MSLENDIQQQVFRNEYQKAILIRLYTKIFIVGRMTEVFKPFDITRQQYNVLRILRGHYPDPVNINLIKERMVEKMSDTSRIVERLRMKGLIQRSLGKTDKRAAEITITNEGLALLKRMRTPVEEFERVLDNLTVGEAQELNYLLDKIRITQRSKKHTLFANLELVNEQEKF